MNFQMDKEAFLSNTTSTPNFLLDEVMPGCNLAELKLLLLIVRQTRGWVDAQGQRKTSDWMSNSYITRRIGCASSSISRAIDSLVNQGFIEVRDGTGNLLTTSVERRRCKRLYFGLALQNGNLQTAKEDGPAQHQEFLCDTMMQGSTHQMFKKDTSPWQGALDQLNASKMLIKTNSNSRTTKESSLTKENINSSFVVIQNEHPLRTSPSGTTISTAPVINEDAFDKPTSTEESPCCHDAQETSSSEVEWFLERYTQYHEQHYNNELNRNEQNQSHRSQHDHCLSSLPAPVELAAAENFHKIEKLLERFPKEEIERLIHMFFTADCTFAGRQDVSLYTSIQSFLNCYNILHVMRPQSVSKASQTKSK
jgi:hypothetical protein